MKDTHGKDLLEFMAWLSMSLWTYEQRTTYQPSNDELKLRCLILESSDPNSSTSLENRFDLETWQAAGPKPHVILKRTRTSVIFSRRSCRPSAFRTSFPFHMSTGLSPLPIVFGLRQHAPFIVGHCQSGNFQSQLSITFQLSSVPVGGAFSSS